MKRCDLPRQTLQSLGETPFLQLLRARLRAYDQRANTSNLSRINGGWQVGIGDDAAVYGRPESMVVTTDMLVENVDFRRRWATWRDVGHKAAAVNVSDIAAMGARPVGLTVALAAAPDESAEDMLQLLLRCHVVGQSFGAPVVGGDLSQTQGPVVISVTALGVAHRKPLLRHQSVVGDCIMVTGMLGAAAAGLVLLERPVLRQALPKSLAKSLIREQLRPRAQIAAAQALAHASCVHSMADISDGLHQDVRHLLAHGQGAILLADALPCARGVRRLAQLAKMDVMQLLVQGGEDFQLVLSVPPEAVPHATLACASVGVMLTQVGVVTEGDGVTYHGHDQTAWQHGRGFSHFEANQIPNGLVNEVDL